MLKRANKIKSQAGFTLVELAIVMIIIGLLIGGVLKGQELINNSQITATVAQIKGIDAATSTFRDMYSALPGDISNPENRLANCEDVPCSDTGSGDGRLQANPGAGASSAGESLSFWAHLAASDLITGVVTDGTAVWGSGLPESKIGGGFRVGYTQTGALTGSAAVGRGGHYLVLIGHPTEGLAASSSILTATQGARIDRKLDDGVTDTGMILYGGNPACNAAGEYVEARTNSDCAIFIRIQG